MDDVLAQKKIKISVIGTRGRERERRRKKEERREKARNRPLSCMMNVKPFSEKKEKKRLAPNWNSQHFMTQQHSTKKEKREAKRDGRQIRRKNEDASLAFIINW